MNPFEQAKLSPLPTPPRECALPYGLTWDDLGPALPDFDEGAQAKAQAFVSHEKQGLNGGPNSCILTLRYSTHRHRVHSETCFVKSIEDSRNAEAQKFQALAACGIPTPTLLATIQRNGAEIIVLEFLPKIGIAFDSNVEVTALLQLMAQLNAIQPPPSIFNLPQQDSPPEAATAFDENVFATLTELSHDLTLPNMIDAKRYFEAYLLAQRACHAMPVAVNHGQLFFQQVGWAQRGTTQQLVFFDLETMWLHPRFTDLASILYSLAVFTGRTEAALFEIYFDRLRELISLNLNIDTAYKEFRLLRITESCYSLPWLVDATRQPESLGLRDSLLMTLQCLSDDLLALGFI